MALTLISAFYNERWPHSSLGKNITPGEFYANWKSRIFRVDSVSIDNPKRAGKFPAPKSTT